MNLKYLPILLFTIYTLLAEGKPANTPLFSRAKPNDTTEHLSHRHQTLELFKKHKLKTEHQWDSLQGFKPGKAKKLLMSRHKDYKVLGWDIFSDGSAYTNYNFSLLSGVIYYSYELDPVTGSYSSIYSWKTTALVDSAKAHNCKTYLCVSNFGAGNNHKFLSGDNARENFTSILINLLQQRGADGVVIDFENIQSSDRDLFTKFVIDLSRKLKQANQSFECILCLYAIDYQKVFDIAAINKYVDEYILMGYDFYGSFSTQSGPVAPLHDAKNKPNYSLEYSVNYYRKQGIAAKKIILGLPYYGAKWKTESTAIPSEVDKFISNPTFADLQAELMNGDTTIGFDHCGVSRYKIADSWFSSSQTWFDDSTTLALKYDWVKYKELGGIAPWTLSYGGDNANLWKLLNAKFGIHNRADNQTNNANYHNPDTVNITALSRVNTLNYFLNNDSIIQAQSKNYKPWYHYSLVKRDMKRTHQIYGFYPFWKDDCGLAVDFAMYSRIGYYAAVPDAKTGAINQSFNWDKLNIKLAHKFGCKVDLILASYDDQANTALLTNDKISETFVHDLLTLVKKAGADGITLDFGYLKNKDKQGFTSFVRDLSTGLRAMDTTYKLNLILCPILCSSDTHFAYDMEELTKYVGFFLLTGFDYYNKNSKVPGPNAPLYSGEKWFPHDINASILKYLSLGIPTQKLILVVPYFGKQWVTINNDIHVFAKTINYNEFDDQILNKSQRLFDTVSLTPCYYYKENEKTYQTWIDDSLSLALKYGFIKANHLAGVGIWALGYDSKNQELTHVVLNEFLSTETIKTEVNMTLSEVLSDMSNLEAMLWIIDLSLLFLVLLILLLSLKICLIRSLVTRFVYFFYAIGFILFIATYFLIRQTNYIENDGSVAIIAFIIIVSLIMIKSMRDSNARKDYP